MKSPLSFCWTLMLLCDQTLSRSITKNFVDLSQILDSNVPRWPGFKAMTMNIAHDRKDGNITIQTETIGTITHIGTHIDAPRHFNPIGWTVEQIPEERLSGPAIVVDIRNQTELDPNYVATVQDLESWENDNGQIPAKSFVLLYTGLGRYWNDTKKYIGNDNGTFDGLQFPGLSLEAAKWLVRNRDILGVGLDSLSLDSAAENNFAAHLVILGANLTALENLANLDQLPVKGAHLDVHPLKLRGASGAPAQIVVHF